MVALVMTLVTVIRIRVIGASMVKVRVPFIVIVVYVVRGEVAVQLLWGQLNSLVIQVAAGYKDPVAVDGFVWLTVWWKGSRFLQGG